MSDLLIVLGTIGALAAVCAVVGYTTYFILSGLKHLKPRRFRGDDRARPVPDTYPPSRYRQAILDGRLKLNERLKSEEFDVAVSMEKGDEYKMSCYATDYVLSRPIGGISRVESIYGCSLMHINGRFLIIWDGLSLHLLDLARDSGLILTPREGQRIEGAFFEGEELVVEASPRGIDGYDSWAIPLDRGDGHPETAAWPGECQLLPGTRA